MLFNSIDFFIFLPIVLGVYLLVPKGYHWIVLLTSSYIFYAMWEPRYIVLIIFSTLLDYTAALCMDKYKSIKRWFLVASLLGNLGLLGFFKYYNFFIDTCNYLDITNLSSLNILLPIGISFYTFQTLSYTIDVYLDKVKPEKHLGYFALYVTYFPQLVAGPIERASNLLPQLKVKSDITSENLRIGFLYIGSGMFKKVVIADRLAIFVDLFYSDPLHYQLPSLIIAAIFFSFQIFCDFSGYSDIAVGVARIFGVRLSENFKQPYMATNFRDLIKRWHITLTIWFRDYVYVPMGGNRHSVNRTVINGLLVFGISGLWHGANWTFVVWGLYLGLVLGIQEWTKAYRNKAFTRLGINRNKISFRLLSGLFTYGLWVLGTHIFRSESLSLAYRSITTINITGLYNFINTDIPDLNLDTLDFKLSILLITLLLIVQSLGGKRRIIDSIINQGVIFRWIFYLSLIIVVYLLGNYGNGAPEFIYFQF